MLNSYVNALNALTVFNDAGDTLEVVGRYNEPFELYPLNPPHRLPDGTWMAICRQERCTATTTSPPAGMAGPDVAELCDRLPNGTSSKPTFDKFGTVSYLGWQEEPESGTCGAASSMWMSRRTA